MRMTRDPGVFERATRERLFPGTLNVEIGTPLKCKANSRIRGVDIGEAGQVLLFERCVTMIELVSSLTSSK